MEYRFKNTIFVKSRLRTALRVIVGAIGVATILFAILLAQIDWHDAKQGVFACFVIGVLFVQWGANKANSLKRAEVDTIVRIVRNCIEVEYPAIRHTSRGQPHREVYSFRNPEEYQVRSCSEGTIIEISGIASFSMDGEKGIRKSSDVILLVTNDMFHRLKEAIVITAGKTIDEVYDQTCDTSAN
jgi:hypothetical protein